MEVKTGTADLSGLAEVPRRWQWVPGEKSHLPPCGNAKLVLINAMPCQPQVIRLFKLQQLRSGGHARLARWHVSLGAGPYVCARPPYGRALVHRRTFRCCAQGCPWRFAPLGGRIMILKNNLLRCICSPGISLFVSLFDLSFSKSSVIYIYIIYIFLSPKSKMFIDIYRHLCHR